MISEQQVLDALSCVEDPELGLNFVELGLIYEVTIKADSVHVLYSLTSPGCPVAEYLYEQILQAIQNVEEVKEASAECIFSPTWSPHMMSEDAKFAFGY